MLEIIVYLSLAGVVIAAAYGVMLYNRLVDIKHSVSQAWSNIDVLLKQRHDELPKLIETCKQFMGYEQETLKQVIAARSHVASAREVGNIGALGAAENMLRVGLGNLFAVAEDYPYVLGTVIAAALLSFYWFVYNWKRLRIIEDTPTAKLRSAHQGYVELEGKGQFIDNRPIYAPLSNHPCLWYSSKIEQQETFTENGRTQTRWNIVYTNTSEHRFRLIDGDSSCDVDPDRAEVNGNERLVWYGNTEWPIRTQMLESQSIVHAMSNRYRYSEWLILPGQPLYILGQFSTASAMAQKSVRDVMIGVINDWKRDQAALRKRFDTNRDGNIDQQEWEAARSEAQIEAQCIYDQLAVEPDTHIIAKPHNSSQPFIISIYPQALLMRKFRRNSYVALSTCIISVCATAWLIHVHG